MSETIQPRVVQRYAALALTVGHGFFEATDLLHLYQNDITPSPSTLLADLTEADFTGYAAKTVNGANWMDFVDGLNRGQKVFPTLEIFTQTGVTITNIVYGWYITDVGGTFLNAVKRLDTPAIFNITDASLALKLIFDLASSADSEEEFFTP